MKNLHKQIEYIYGHIYSLMSISNLTDRVDGEEVACSGSGQLVQQALIDPLGIGPPMFGFIHVYSRFPS